MQVRLPVYREEDSLYIRAFGMEKEGFNARWGPGRRDVGIVHYVLQGRGFFNGRLVEANQGFYIPPHSFCEYGPDPDCPWNYFWMDCSEEFSCRYACNSLKPDENGIFSYNYSRQIESFAHKILEGPQTISSVEALGYGFLILALHSPQEPASRGSQYVLQAKSFIESSIGKNISVTDVADAVNIHDRYLYNLFIQYEGESPKDYILRKKIELAEDLLAHTTLPVSEIAQATGIFDLYSFSRLFKRKRGMSPTAFRKSVKI